MNAKLKRFSKIIAILVAMCLTVTLYIPLTATAEDNSELLVGASVQLITPKPEMYPLLRKAAGDLVGVIDDLHVRVIALNDGTTTSLILSFETGRGPYAPVFAKELAEHTGVNQEAIFFTASHAHAAPEITSDIDLTADDNYAKWGRYVMQQMLVAADDAIANMEPAEVGIGYADSYTNVNRNATYKNDDGTTYRSYGYNGEGFSDKRLTAIQFNSKATGEPIAFVVSHATHGIVMNANEYFDDAYEGINYSAEDKYCDGLLGVHPDMGGYVSNYLEENFEGSVALWLCGAAGDQGPLVMNQIWTADPVTGAQEDNYIAGASVEICEYLAKIQYADVLTALSTIEEFNSEVTLAYALDSTDVPGRGTSADVTMHLQLLRIGDIALVGNAGELYNSIGTYMRENSDLKDTIVVNCCWNNASQTVSYWVDDDAIVNGGANGTGKYEAGCINEYMTDLMNYLIEETGGGNVE